MRKSRETTLAEWTKEWRATARTGRFAVANRIPPSLRPTQHFVALQDEREVFGRVVQCRTGHCFQGAYYKTFVPSEDVDCPRGERLQTREHSLRECPRYDAFRGKLRDASRNIVLSEILGTPRGIEALSGFLRRSGAFTRQESRARRQCLSWNQRITEGGRWKAGKTRRSGGDLIFAGLAPTQTTTRGAERTLTRTTRGSYARARRD